MARKGLPPEQIISTLREAEVLLNKGESTPQVWRAIGVSEHTCYRWRKTYGGMQVNRAKKMKELEKENTQLKKLVADLSLDNAILKKVSRGNF